MLLETVFDRVGVKCKSLCLFGDFVYIIRVRVSDGNDGMTTVEVEIFIPFCIVSITAFPRFYFYIYKPFTHQHLDEIRQSLSKLQNSFSAPINFIPVRGNFSRGIFASLYLDCPVEIELLKDLYNSYYDDHNFTFLTDKMPDLKQVVNTNKCLLYLEKHDNKLLIVSVIDNLLKGASGQAVHNMNLLFGLHERVGLHLKPSAF